MPFQLIHLSDDELELLFIALGDLLRPRVAIALSSTCHGLRRPTVAAGATLRKRHEAVQAVARKAAMSHHALADAERVDLMSKRVQVPDCRALADVIESSGMARLTWLNLAGCGSQLTARLTRAPSSS